MASAITYTPKVGVSFVDNGVTYSTTGFTAVPKSMWPADMFSVSKAFLGTFTFTSGHLTIDLCNLPGGISLDGLWAKFLLFKAATGNTAPIFQENPGIPLNDPPNVSYDLTLHYTPGFRPGYVLYPDANSTRTATGFDPPWAMSILRYDNIWGGIEAGGVRGGPLFRQPEFSAFSPHRAHQIGPNSNILKWKCNDLDAQITMAIVAGKRSFRVPKNLGNE